MGEVISDLQNKIKKLQRILRKVSGKQVRSEGIIDEIRSLVKYYFEVFRQTYIKTGRSESELLKLDSLMQGLLRYAQRYTTVSKYLKILKKIFTILNELEIKSTASMPESDIFDKRGYQDIIGTLSKIAPSAAQSFEQGLKDLQDDSRISWRGTVVEFRESLREVLDILAPDKEVKKQSWFRMEPNAKGPTMKQKVIFILKARQTPTKQREVLTNAIEIIEECLGKFVRSVYELCSAGVHIPISRDEAIRVRKYVILVLSELLEIST